MKSVKTKRNILAVILAVFVLATIGITWAFSHDSSNLNNDFGIAKYETIFTDDFTAPSDWRTCETKPKAVTITNNSDVPVVARIKLDEQWLDKNDQELPLISTASGLRMAQINFDVNSGWLQQGEYYYFDGELATGESTPPLFTGVTLNCEANLDTSEEIWSVSDGAYSDAEYHLVVTAQTLQASAKKIWDTTGANVISLQSNADFYIDFTKQAKLSNDIFEANGNGVNKFTENGVDIYYFRGNVANNNVLWGGYCWKMIRTTYTGGIKMIYNGAPTMVDGTQQCLASGAAAEIGTARYNGGSFSPADVGYMYGDRVESVLKSAGSGNYIFSNDVSRDGNTYTLDTADGQSITGTWADKRVEASTRYHYFCTNGASQCDRSQIGYIFYFDEFDNGLTTISYLPIGGYDNIDAFLAAAYRNDNNSGAKATVENWFANSGLVALEDDLEDAVYCNDRTVAWGAFKGKDSPALIEGDRSIYFYGQLYGESVYGELYRSWLLRDENDNPTPSFACPNLERDGFTKSTANGNGQLRYKVGLITGTEILLAGAAQRIEGSPGDTEYYLYNDGHKAWSISPWSFDWRNALNYVTDGYLRPHGVWDMYGIRPVVSLKPGKRFVSGDGLKTNPYIVE